MNIVPHHERPTYWNSRRHQNYYAKVVRHARQFVPWARSVLDVGSCNCEYVNWLEWIPYRERVDRQPLKPLEGVVTVQSDFMSYEPGRVFDLVLCLQVLEHLENPAAFCEKLFAMGKVVILSVPYKWPYLEGSGHLQDPVDGAKLLSWTGRPWLKKRIVKDGRGPTGRRLVAVFKGDACPPYRALELKLRTLR